MAVHNGVYYESPDDARARDSRMQAFQGRMLQHPGARPGGTGSTGIAPNLGITGLKDWTTLLEQQQQYATDTASARGAAPPSVRTGGYTMSGGGAPLPSPRDTGRGGVAMHPALAGLKSAMGGGGGGRESLAGLLDTKLQRQFAHQSPDEIMQALSTMGMSPLELQGKSNADYAGAVAGRRAARDPFEAATEAEDLTDLSTRRAGARYNFPEVREPRMDEFLNKMAQIERQYIDPANIKSAADLGAAEYGFMGQRERADATRAAGQSRVDAARNPVGPLAGMIGDFAGYEDSLANPEMQKLLQMLAQMMQQQGGRR